MATLGGSNSFRLSPRTVADEVYHVHRSVVLFCHCPYPMKIILGSQSPRRHELMTGLDIPFRTVSIDADESFPPDLTAGDIPLYISREKAEAYLPLLQPDELLITADTIVWLNGQMLGKPTNTEDARRMLHLLSGQDNNQVFRIGLTYLPYPLTYHYVPFEPHLEVSYIRRNLLFQ